MSTPTTECECCLGNGYLCLGCDPYSGLPEMPHGYIHANGYIWDAKNDRQLGGPELIEERDRLAARVAELEQKLEEEQETHAWDYTPAMAEASIHGHADRADKLAARVAELEGERAEAWEIGVLATEEGAQMGLGEFGPNPYSGEKYK